MKRIYVAVLLSVLFSAATIANINVRGKTYLAVGDYTIQVSDEPVALNGEMYKAYRINYTNSPLQVNVVVMNDKARKCKKYVVLSDELSVQYVCNEKYFGVEKLDKSLAQAGLTTSDASLDRSAYFHQKVICGGGNSELENTKLIAAYFPELIKDKYSLTTQR